MPSPDDFAKKPDDYIWLKPELKPPVGEYYCAKCGINKVLEPSECFWCKHDKRVSIGTVAEATKKIGLSKIICYKEQTFDPPLNGKYSKMVIAYVSA